MLLFKVDLFGPGKVYDRIVLWNLETKSNEKYVGRRTIFKTSFSWKIQTI